MMEERKFECGDKVYIEKVVAQCSCQLKEKIEIRGRVVKRDGSDGMFIHTRVIQEVMRTYP